MKLKHIFREYFSYTASEKKGLLVLVTLLLILYLLPFVLKRTETSGSIINQKKQKQIDSLISSIENSEINRNTKDGFQNLFLFDPNKVSEDELRSLGFTSFQTNNLIKFRSKGGQFKEKRDLLKIYGVKQSDLDQLSDYILLSPGTTPEKREKSIGKKKLNLYDFDPNLISLKEWEDLGVENRIGIRIKKYLAAGGSFKRASDLGKIYGFDSVKMAELVPYVKILEGKYKDKDLSQGKLLIPLNGSDTTQLKQLPGIGSKLSSRIVKYRELLGGFVSKDQILEVYGISSEEYIRISAMLFIDSTFIRKLELNSFDAERLKKHPYVDYRTSKDIVRFRDRNGVFNSIDQLQSHKIVPDSIYLKLLPYLELE